MTRPRSSSSGCRRATGWPRTRRAFAPIAVGRYFIHRPHRAGARPAGRIGLAHRRRDRVRHRRARARRAAALSRSTGSRGARRRRRMLDMGTRHRDPGDRRGQDLARAARRRVRHRSPRRCVSPAQCRGRTGVAAARAGAHGSYRERALRRRAPYDLIFANILARPLIAMARELARALAPGGVAVLVGLLPWQESAVLAAHRTHAASSCAGASSSMAGPRSCSRRGANPSTP